MNIFDVFKRIEQDDWQEYSNGWNNLLHGRDAYEILITDKKGSGHDLS